MRIHKLLGLVFAALSVAACGDGGPGEPGGGGSGGTTAQGGGGSSSGPCANVPDGSAAKEQAQGDCKKNVCQSGMVTAVDDDNDVPDDGQDCTVDGCDAGEPTSELAAPGAACNQSGGNVCDDSGKCVECNEDQDCADPAAAKCNTATHECILGECADAVMDGDETDVDCGGGTCAPCEDGKACLIAEDCASSVCTDAVCQVPTCSDAVKNGGESDADCGGASCPQCELGKQCGTADANCASGHCSDTVCCGVACAGLCLSCNVAGTVGTCALVPLGEDPADECAGNGGSDVCDGNGACAGGNGAACGAAAECASSQCVDGVCCSSACGGPCKACAMAKTGEPDGTCADVMTGTDPDDECPGSLTCEAAGACSAPLANGTACAAAAECASGFCVDGVCCNTACNGLCRACTAVLQGQGVEGVCGPIEVGTDPENECSGAMSCNGAGACN